jgi:hypothetical protein
MSLLARLIEAGTPADLVAEVARELARAEVAQEAIATRRAADRERQQRRRDNVTSRDIADVTGAIPLSRPPNENKSNPPTHTPGDISTRARKAEPFPKPEWCESSQVWTDLKANRKAKRLPNTPTAYSQFLRDIEQWVDDEWPPGRLLEAIVARGWASARYDPRENQPNGRPTPTPSVSSNAGRGQRPNRCLDMLLTAEAEIRAGEHPEPDFEAGPALRAIGYG